MDELIVNNKVQAFISTLTVVLFSVYVLFIAACRPGTYKASAKDAYCTKCPPHSYSQQEKASECTCEKGYYRADMDLRSMACTSKLMNELVPGGLVEGVKKIKHIG